MVHQLEAPPLMRGQHYRMSLEEFLDFVPENWHAEWVDGEGYIFMASDTRHARVLAFLFGLIQQYVQLFNLGEVFFPTYSVRLRGGRSYREPDIFVVLHEHRDRIRKDGVYGPADFILEGVSEDSVKRDRVDKFREFEAEGVPEYVYVDARDNPDEMIEFFRRDAAGKYQRVAPDEQGRLHSEVLSGFWFDPRWLLQDPLPDIFDTIMLIAPDAYRRRLSAGPRLPRNPENGT
jgi:Uma2 family endonuclease